MSTANKEYTPRAAGPMIAVANGLGEALELADAQPRPARTKEASTIAPQAAQAQQS